jgi:hypothetical protein
MSVEKSGILQLPNDLLFNLLQLSRPSEFEALMLTCKQVYAVGASLVKEHNVCKNWPRQHLIVSNTGHIVINEIFQFLLDLTRLLSSRQRWLLSYFEKVYWNGGVYQSDHVTPSEVVRKIDSEGGWLQRQLMLVYDSLEGVNFEHIASAMGPVDMLRASESLATDHLEVLNGVLPSEFYEVIPLLLFHNLQSLVAARYPILRSRGDRPTISAIIHHCDGRLYFQNLQTIRIHETMKCTFSDVDSILLLPQLKTLITENLRGTADEDGEVKVYEWPYGNRQSKLEQLVLHTANETSSSVGAFLKPLKLLRAFVWEDFKPDVRVGYLNESEDGTDNDGDSRTSSVLEDNAEVPMTHEVTVVDEAVASDDSEMSLAAPSVGGGVCPAEDSVPEEAVQEASGDPIETPDDPHADLLQRLYEGDDVEEELAQLVEEDKIGLEHRLLSAYWRPVTDYDSDDVVEDEEDEGQDDNEKEEEGEGNSRQPSEWGCSWNPAELVSEMLAMRKDTLEHLALTISFRNIRYPPIKRKHQISHFKDFPKLKQLELDTRVLRSLVGKRRGVPPDGIPRSMADMLPPSIEMVILVVPEFGFEVMYGILRRLPRETGRFPNLRSIRVLHQFDPDIGRLDMLLVEKGMQPLVSEFASVGVTLHLQGLDHTWAGRHPELDSWT